MERLREWAAHREWSRLRLLSDDGPAFARDRHTYTAHPVLEDRGRGIDLLTPSYSLLDLTPAGRGDWDPSNEAIDAALRVLT